MKYVPNADVLNARNALLAVGAAHQKAEILWALKMAEHGYKPEQVAAEIDAYVAAGGKVSYRKAIARVASGKADGNPEAGNVHEFAYASAGKAATKRKAARKAKATKAKAPTTKGGNPLAGVKAAQAVAWLHAAGIDRAVFALLAAEAAK